MTHTVKKNSSDFLDGATLIDQPNWDDPFWQSAEDRMSSEPVTPQQERDRETNRERYTSGYPGNDHFLENHSTTFREMLQSISRPPIPQTPETPSGGQIPSGQEAIEYTAAGLNPGAIGGIVAAGAVMLLILR